MIIMTNQVSRAEAGVHSIWIGSPACPLTLSSKDVIIPDHFKIYFHYLLYKKCKVVGELCNINHQKDNNSHLLTRKYSLWLWLLPVKPHNAWPENDRVQLWTPNMTPSLRTSWPSGSRLIPLDIPTEGWQWRTDPWSLQNYCYIEGIYPCGFRHPHT